MKRYSEMESKKNHQIKSDAVTFTIDNRELGLIEKD